MSTRRTFLLVLFLAGSTSIRSSTAGELELTLSLGTGAAPPSRAAEIPLTLSSSADVQELVAAFGWDVEGIEGVDLVPGPVLEVADIVVRRVESSYMVLVVVVDENGLGPDTIAAGDDIRLATVHLRCRADTIDEVETPLSFRDGAFAAVKDGPLLDNIAVLDGVVSHPLLSHGSFTCVPVNEICDDDRDNDGDGLSDCDDPDCDAAAPCDAGNQTFALGTRRLNRDLLPDPVTAMLGQTVDIGFFYNSPEDFVAGGPQFDQIQGISMVVCFPCGLRCREDSLDISDTIVGAVEADFVDLQCDNDPVDGDGCELILGILVDTLPPFDGGTLPPTDRFLGVGTVTFDVEDDPALCGQTLPIEFCDGANGGGKVPIANIVATENTSVRPALRNNTISFLDRPRFYRGDCDFNGRLNISDATGVVLAVFGTGANPHMPACFDSCDCNDDGRVDFADTVCVLRYLFLNGAPPPPPGPGFNELGERIPPGEDPSSDGLDCVGGATCLPQ